MAISMEMPFCFADTVPAGNELMLLGAHRTGAPRVRSRHRLKVQLTIAAALGLPETEAHMLGAHANVGAHGCSRCIRPADSAGTVRKRSARCKRPSENAPGGNRTRGLRFERPLLFGSPKRTVDH